MTITWSGKETKDWPEIWLFFLLQFICAGLAQDDVMVTVTPSRFVASLSTNATTFNCTVTPSTATVQLLIILVNGEQDSKELQSMGIVSTRLSNTFGTVSIETRAENNNSEISCLAVLAGAASKPVISEPATLLIQGVLSSPPSLTIVSIASRPYFPRLTWQRPYTVDRSEIVDYWVCFNFSVSQVCTLTEDTSYEFLNIRLPLVFRVTAINVVGESEASLVVYQPCGTN